MAPFIPLKARIQLTLFSFISGRAMGDSTINRRFIDLFLPFVPTNSKPKSGVCSADVMIDSTRDLYVRIYVPSGNSEQEKLDKLPLVVYFHGGGFVFGSPDLSLFDDWCRRMCSGLRAVIASVNYRRAPEHKCPAPYDDGVDVLKFLDSGGLMSVDILANLNVDLESCFLAGDTAGGNISHHVARQWAASADTWDKVNIKGVIPITPMFGGEERTDADVHNQKLPDLTIEKMDWHWKAFLPEGANRNHVCAHPFRTNTKLEERFPPVLVVAAGYDMLRDWQLKYYEWLNEMKHKVRLLMYPDVIHGFYLYTAITESTKVVGEMKAFIDEHKSQ